MRLDDIGFYTLTEKRAQEASSTTPIWRLEMILGGNCNFKCPYCRGLKNPAAMTEPEATEILLQCMEAGLKNVRFSGGEPTLYNHLPRLVKLAKAGGVERIAISTNGSAPWSRYQELLDLGVNDFSVSLDACCSATGELMCGRKLAWENVVENIRRMALQTYVTVGIVAATGNRAEIGNTIALAHRLGVSDIRVIPAAQDGNNLDFPEVPLAAIVKRPILKYRMWRTGMKFRGLSDTDNRRCPLTLDDMAVANGDHYPCIIYLRERGAPIGKFTNISEVRVARKKFAEEHDCHADPICRKNCLDVCVAYNNRHLEYHNSIRPPIRAVGGEKMVDFVYVPQERAFAPGIAGEWPAVIPHPRSKNGRLVKTNISELRDWFLKSCDESAKTSLDSCKKLKRRCDRLEKKEGRFVPNKKKRRK